MKSTVILCADDFGLSPGVNRAILDLAAQSRLSAVSCMSLAPFWEEGAAALKLLHDKVAVGLHLTLTYLPPLTKELGARHPSEKTVILKSWSRGLDLALVEKELKAQFEKFIAVWRAAPDYIDGHQHIHILPAVRDIVLRLRKEYAPKAWVRSVVDFSPAALSAKQLVLNLLGWNMRETLRQQSIPHNDNFRGAYNYAAPADFPALMTRWSKGDGSVLVYCHPAFPDEALGHYDTLIEPRRREYDFLAGDGFGKLLADKISLTRNPATIAEVKLTHQLLRFIVTGGVNTVFGYLMYAFAVLVLNDGYFAAIIFSYAVGVTFSYFMFRAFVFTAGERGLKSYARFLPTYCMLLVFNIFALHLLVDGLDWNKLAAQAVIVPVCAALSFVLNKLFVFK